MSKGGSLSLLKLSDAVGIPKRFCREDSLQYYITAEAFYDITCDFLVSQGAAEMLATCQNPAADKMLADFYSRNRTG